MKKAEVKEMANMSKIKFENANKGVMSAGAPRWQTEAIKRAEQEYSEQAEKVNAMFKARLLEALESHPDALPGRLVRAVAEQVPRYAYMKNIEDAAGNKYDAEIDLLMGTVLFTEQPE